MLKLLLTILLMLPNTSPAPAQATGQPEGGDNTMVALQARVTRIQCVGSDMVELEVTSTDPFPVRDALTELQVGPVVTTLSRYPDDGDLHTLIFALSRDELASTSSDDQAVVRYNPSNLHDTWLIGPIDGSSVQDCNEALNLRSLSGLPTENSV